jgi:hypothetical protein
LVKPPSPTNATTGRLVYASHAGRLPEQENICLRLGRDLRCPQGSLRAGTAGRNRIRRKALSQLVRDYLRLRGILSSAPCLILVKSEAEVGGGRHALQTTPIDAHYAALRRQSAPLSG